MNDIFGGYWWLIIIIFCIILFFSGIRIIRPTTRGLIERLGKYVRFAHPGFHWVVPVIEKMYRINITEQMVDAKPQENLQYNVKQIKIFSLNYELVNLPKTI
jgi:regulator of protease activity HflC (stomatin/prohibitin superfamily)